MPDDARTDAERRFDLPAGTFPFESRFCRIGGAKLHYVDEGSGPVLFMLHGNPSWAFVYRHIIAALRKDCRCVALDLAGFGLSEAPPRFTFYPEDHARLVAAFLDALDLEDATLVAHDWGGPIGLRAMVATEGRITRLCLGNTWAWPVNGDFHFEWFSRLMGGAVGRFLTTRYLAFVNFVMPASMKRRKLSDIEMAAYRGPFAERSSRKPLHVFPRQITGAKAWLAALEQDVKRFTGPVNLIWPDGDIAFRGKELERWRETLPQAEVVTVNRCGHYLWEDAPDECVAHLRALLN
jgi:haloalkane dehalogenase